MSLLVANGLTKRYGRRVGVAGVDLSVEPGVCFGFIGPNGAGKTTTIRLLTGLLRPTAGSASIFGMDCWRASAHIKADVGYLPGDLRLYPWLTGSLALSIFGQVRGRNLAPHGIELAGDFDLDMDLRVRRMSRGMRQKLGLILALAHRPKLLILDEPTSALDPLMKRKLYRRLRELASAGHTVFFSSHTLSEVEELCDRVAIVREGTIVADDTIEALRVRAQRVVSLVWRSDAAAHDTKAPPFLDVVERNGRGWTANLTGSSEELVRWAANQPMADLSVGPPDLKRLFERYYE